MSKPVQEFNSTFTQILNASQAIQLRVNKSVDPAFKEKRKELAMSLALDFECVIKTLGPILEQYKDDIVAGNIDKFLSITFADHADTKENREFIEKHSEASRRQFNNATPEERALFLRCLQKLLACHYDYLLQK